MQEDLIQDNGGEEEDVVTLVTDNGEEVDFVIVAEIPLNGGFYEILQPVELLDGMEDDEALVFKVTEADGDTCKYEIVLDDEIIDAVFAKYNEILDSTDGE